VVWAPTAGVMLARASKVLSSRNASDRLPRTLRLS
jgi:hypothetical protein